MSTESVTFKNIALKSIMSLRYTNGKFSSLFQNATIDNISCDPNQIKPIIKEFLDNLKIIVDLLGMDFTDEFIKDDLRDAKARIETTLINFYDEMKKPERILELFFEFNRHINNLCNDLEYLVQSGNYRYSAIFVKVDYFLFYLTQIAYLFKVNDMVLDLDIPSEQTFEMLPILSLFKFKHLFGVFRKISKNSYLEMGSQEEFFFQEITKEVIQIK